MFIYNYIYFLLMLRSVELFFETHHRHLSFGNEHAQLFIRVVLF